MTLSMEPLRRAGPGVVGVLLLPLFAGLGFVLTSAVMQSTRENAPPDVVAIASFSTVSPDPDLIALFVGAESCAFSTGPIVRSAAEALSTRVRQEAEERQLSSSLIGVSIDPSPTTGLAYLDDFGVFDEHIAGAGWALAPVVKHLADQIGGSVPTPQVLVFERDSRTTSAIGERRSHQLRLRVVGETPIVRWLSTGARIPIIESSATTTSMGDM